MDGFNLNIAGTPDIPLLVEVRTNLVLGNWEPLQTLSVTNGSIPFHDPATTTDPARFYRVRFP